MDDLVPVHGDEPPGSYSQDLSNVAVDPTGMVDASWAIPNQQYAHQDIVTPQPAYQQYQPLSYSQYGAYGTPQDVSYPTTPYSSLYASQYQHTTPTDPFGPAHYGVGNTQYPTIPDHVFQGSGNAFQYPIHVNNSTVSPQALDRFQFQQTSPRNDGSSVYQRSSGSNDTFAQSWVSNSQSYAHDAPISDVFFSNQIPRQPAVPDNTSFRVDDVGVATQNETAPYKSIFGDKKPFGTKDPTTAKQWIRTTHPELLTKTNNDPSTRLKNAPFAVLSNVPRELSISTKGAKIPVYKPRHMASSAVFLTGRAPPPLSGTEAFQASTDQRDSNKSILPKQGIKRSKVKDAKRLPTPRPVAALKTATSTPSPRSEASSPEDDTSSAEYSDATDDEDMEFPEDLISNHRSVERPVDIAEAAAWDAIGVTFISAHRRATPEETGNGINELEKLITRFRGEIKRANTALASAKAGKDTPDATSLSKNLAVRRQALVNVLRATAEHGHIDILENLGKNEKLIAAFGSMLVECINEQDLAGELPKAILKIMSKVTTLTDTILDKVKFFKVAKRFVNNSGDAEVKTMIEAIKASTPEATERTAKEKKVEVEEKKVLLSVQQNVEKQKIADSKQTSLPTGTKRVREPETSDASATKPPKKPHTDVTGVSAQKVTKAASVTQRTSPVFASLARSAQKHQAAAAKATVAKPAVKPETPKPVITSTPRVGLAEILASIQNPTPAPEPVPIVSDKAKEKERSEETPAQKAKREVKERRRLLNLRVRFPEKSELEQVRYFTHDLAEDEGRQGDLLRDANNTRSEGMMHRLQSSHALSSMDMNDGPVTEVDYRPYPELQEIDFSLINQSAIGKNYTTRAGSVLVDTPQQHIQHNRESTQLIVIYTDPSDIPSSPKEPPFEILGSSENDRYFRQPAEPWVLQRLQEIRQYGTDSAMSVFIRRAKDRESQEIRDGGQSRLLSQPLSGTSTNLTSILNSLKTLSAESQQSSPLHSAASEPALQYTTTSQYPQVSSTYQKSATSFTASATPIMDPTELEKLLRTVASLKGKPYPPVEPPEWYKGNPRMTAQWWEGYYRDNPDAAIKKSIDDKAIQEQTQHLPAQLAQPQAQPHLPQPDTQYAPSQGYSMLLPNTIVAAPPVYDSNQLLGILAGLQNTQNNPTQPQQQQDWNSSWTSAGNVSNNYDQVYASHNRDQGNHSSWDSSRSENDNTHPSYGNQIQDNGPSRGRDGGYGSEDRHGGSNSNIRPNKNGDYKRNTKPCKFWAEGKCAKGANCTFRHD